MEQLIEGHSLAIVAVQDLSVLPDVRPVPTEIEEHLHRPAMLRETDTKSAWYPRYVQLPACAGYIRRFGVQAVGSKLEHLLLRSTLFLQKF